MRRHNDNRQLREMLMYPITKRQPVHHGHTNISQYHIGQLSG